jgi:hypothetical protein
MTRDEAKQWIPILQAYAAGSQVQCNHITDGWVDKDQWSFNSPIEDYRIKPMPVLRPWNEAEIEAECIKGTVIKWVDAIGPLVKCGTDIRVGIKFVGHLPGAAKTLKDLAVIAATGAPCGVME